MHHGLLGSTKYRYSLNTTNLFRFQHYQLNCRKAVLLLYSTHGHQSPLSVADLDTVRIEWISS